MPSTTNQKSITLKSFLPYILLVGGIIGVLASGILLLEKINLLQNPTAELACDINPIVACGSVITTAQASAFDIPNPIIGLAGFGAVAAIGAGMLAGAVYRRWFWLGMQAGVTFGLGFIMWLQFQTIYRINALCPYCIVVWMVMIPIFWYTTLHNLREGHIRLSKKFDKAATFAQKNHGNILITWFLIIIALILTHFWYYWKTIL